MARGAVPGQSKAGDELGERGFERSRSTGSAVRRASRRSHVAMATPTRGRRQAKPSSSEPSNSFVTRYTQLQRLRARGSRGRRRPGSTTQSSASSSWVSTRGAIGRAGRDRADVDERDEGAAARDDPAVELAAVAVEARGGRRPRELERLAWTKRGSEPAGAPVSATASESGTPDARQTSRERSRGRRRGGRAARSRTPAATESLTGHRPPSSAQEERRRVVGERRLPTIAAARRAGSGVGSRTAQAGGVDARGQVAAAPPRSRTAAPACRNSSRAQSARGRDAGVHDVVEPADVARNRAARRSPRRRRG